MKILIVSGSFKDVYSPSEAVDMLGEIFEINGYEVEKCPFCDGGEYTYDILKRTLEESKEVVVDNVINSYGQEVQTHFLVDKNDVAHIVSSEILRLYPNEDCYKNPLKLTDYGIGQLISSAIQNGHRCINLYLGGTSTVCMGMGMLQALGGKLYDGDGNLLKAPVITECLSNVCRIESQRYDDIIVRVIGDGDAKADEMTGITKLKIGKVFQKDKERILEKTGSVIEAIVKATDFGYKRPFSGAAGGLRFGLDCLFDVTYVLGGNYFSQILELKNKISNCDYVVTGEGCYDNTACGKSPASIGAIASSLGKPVILVCGQIEKREKLDYRGGIVKNIEESKELGFDIVLTCQEFYDKHPAMGAYIDQINYFRKETPRVIKEIVGGLKL